MQDGAQPHFQAAASGFSERSGQAVAFAIGPSRSASSRLGELGSTRPLVDLTAAPCTLPCRSSVLSLGFGRSSVGGIGVSGRTQRCAFPQGSREAYGFAVPYGPTGKDAGRTVTASQPPLDAAALHQSAVNGPPAQGPSFRQHFGHGRDRRSWPASAIPSWSAEARREDLWQKAEGFAHQGYGSLNVALSRWAWPPRFTSPYRRKSPH